MRLGPLLLAAIIGCQRESDAAKLNRLQQAREDACRPVLVADSVAHAHDAAIARLQSLRDGRSPYGSGEQAIRQIRADQAEARQAIADLESRPTTLATQDSAAAQRSQCALAERAFAGFMGGR